MAMTAASAKGYKIPQRLARGAYEIPAFVGSRHQGTSRKVYVAEIDFANQTLARTG